MDTDETIYVVSALGYQTLLLVHFAVRWRRRDLAIRFGWIVYALAVPAAIGSAVLVASGASWSFAAAGLLYLAWAAYGAVVEYAMRIRWRSPIRWSVFVPYTALYLATSMFFWWPLAEVGRPLWYIAGALFAGSTLLNVASHRPRGSAGERA
ncbi:hypothetical protein P0L94_05345 [Microbacter sp. GSS18]|nr:hypothetical protein P0L94_05345 [Microbacter sp. GSS18]